MTFKIEAGQTCAFVGPSGSGKTSLVEHRHCLNSILLLLLDSGKSSCINLLERFYDPSSGSILIDGQDIHDYDHKYLHTKISMVGQEPVLFNRTIKENIAYAVLDSDQTNSKDDTAIVRAAEAANAHGFITDLVNGYNTMCGQRGGHLSGRDGSSRMLLSSFHRRWTETTCMHSASDRSKTDDPPPG